MLHEPVAQRKASVCGAHPGAIGAGSTLHIEPISNRLALVLLRLRLEGGYAIESGEVELD